MFVAGSEASAVTMNWTILHMQEFPEVQEKCQREITEVGLYVLLIWKIVLSVIDYVMFVLFHSNNILVHQQQLHKTIHVKGSFFSFSEMWEPQHPFGR